MDSEIPSGMFLQKLQQAEEEFNHNNINIAVDICNDVVESLQEYLTSFKQVKNETKQGEKSIRKRALAKLPEQISCQTHHEKEPIEFLSISDLTQLVTNPPGDTCSEGTFGTAFAMYGEDFARDVFKILKKSSVPTLQSIARWCLIGIQESYCANILASGNTPKFDEGPDPVLFYPIHDSGEARFNDESIYPTTTALSNLVRKFVQDLDLNYMIHTLSIITDCFLPPVSFHTDLFIKEKALSLAISDKSWLDFQLVFKHPGLQNELAMLYVLARLKRVHCYFVKKQYSQSLEDASAILKVTIDLPIYIRATAHVFIARSSYNLGRIAQGTVQTRKKESDEWIAERECLQFYKTACTNYAKALELMDDSEFNAEMHECNTEMMISLHKVLVAQRRECQPNICCLCWRNTSLRGSHFIPRFILAKLSYKGDILVGEHLKGPKQIKYRMLCSECEQRFCNWGEKPFCDMFFEKVLQQPSRSLGLVHGNWLYYFFASLIWRICFVMKYTAIKFSDILAKVPMIALRRFLLTSKVQNLTTDCFLYLFIDKHVFDEVFCKLSRNKSFGREGINCSFLVDESLFICSFCNFYVVFPVGPIKNAFLMQGPLKRLKFGEGLFLIEEDSQRCMPVFLERFICGEVADEYEIILSKLPEGTYNKMSSKNDEGGSNSSTSYLPKVIKCLPDNISVTFNPMFKFGIEIFGGIEVKLPPIDCELGEDSDQRYTLYLCEDEKGSKLALYRMYSENTNRIYAFKLSLASTGEVDHFSICDDIKNVQYAKALLKYNPTLEDFLKSLISVMVLSDPPQMNVHFFPEGAEKVCQLNHDGSLLLPSNFTIIGKPVSLKNVTVWLCEFDGTQTIAIVRLFCEIAYDEVPPYDSLAALQFELDKESIKPLYSPHNVSFDDEVVLKLLHDLHTVCIETIKLLMDLEFQSCFMVNCLPSEIKCLEFFPLDNAPSIMNITILNGLGMRKNPGLEFHSWLCSYRNQNKSMLIVIQKWKIATLHFIIAFHFKQSETDPLQISNLISLPGARYITIFMKMVRDLCPNDFDIVTRNVVLSVQAGVKVNSRIESIFNTGYDPLISSPISFDSSAEAKETDPCPETDMNISLEPLVCLPDGCSLASTSGTEKLQLSEEYSLVCSSLETPLYTVWLCVYKDVHEFIVVKTKSGIEYVCSSVVVALDFVAAHSQGSHSSHPFRFYPFIHLNRDESSFVEDDFLASETQFQNDDSQFSVLMTCVQILLSQLYQLYNLQVYLPLEFQVDMASDEEVELVYPHPFIAGPLQQETLTLSVTCWLCEEGIGMVKWEKKSNKRSFITALTFEYFGNAIAKLELVDLPMGLQFLAQSTLYLEQNLSFLITTMLKSLCDSYVSGTHMKKLQ